MNPTTTTTNTDTPEEAEPNRSGARAGTQQAVQCGQRLQYRIDALTLVAIQYAVARVRQLCLDVPVNHSTIIRAAVEMYVKHLDNTRALMATLDPTSDEWADRQLTEKRRITRANRGGSAPWSSLPHRLLEDDPAQTLSHIIRDAFKAQT